MKRTNTFSIMAALLLAGVSTIVSCTKDDEQPAEGKTYHMTVTASKGGDNAKDLDLTDEGTTISATWAVDDTVTVYNVTKGAALTGSLAALSSGASTTLEGDLTGTIEAGDSLLLKFCSPDYSMQDGTLAYIASHCDYAEATVKVTSVAGGEIAANAAFENKQAIVKFTLLDADGNDLDASVLSVTVDDVIYATIPTSTTNVLYVALPGISERTVTLSAKVGDQWYNRTQTGVTFVDGQYYTVAAKLEQKGMLPGTFSVGVGKKVHFSQGNLQATYDGSNWTWAFAANQYDTIGNAAGNTSVTSTSPYISGNGTVDLFGWVGASSTWTGVAKYGITSSTDTNNVIGYGNRANEGLKADWGTLAISNGGNTSNSGWRMLTGGSNGEWKYLINGRTITTTHYVKATVDGKSGVILFPDVYTHPTDLRALQSVNPIIAEYTTNEFNAAAWAKMEAAGAVFLPAAGRRKMSTAKYVGDAGLYWSSSSVSSNPNNADFFNFSKETVNSVNNNPRFLGFSVRLVCPVK